MGRVSQDQITRYIKEAIDISGSYLIEDVIDSLCEIMPRNLQYSVKFSEINEKLNALKTKREKKKKEKLLNYVA
jgi:hypothetical protein